MDKALKQRLVGAVVLVALVVVFVPMLVGVPTGPEESIATTSPEGTNGRPEPDDGGARLRLAAEIESPSKPPADAARAPSLAEPPGAQVVKVEPVSLPVEPPAPKMETAVVPEPAKERPAPTPTRNEGWAVQLASFSKKQNAIALRDKLRADGYAAFVRSATSGTKTMTRVLVGPQPQKDEAKALAKKLYAAVSLKGIVVKYPEK